jgi:hypothetical protein
MNFKPFDRFFIFVLALATALYFFGSKPYHSHASDKAATAVSTDVKFESLHDGTSVPPVGVETKEEQVSEDDESSDDDESSEGEGRNERADAGLYPGFSLNAGVSTARNAYHCPLHIRLRTILI